MAADNWKNNNNNITAYTECSIALFICELKYPFAQSTAFLFICKYFFESNRIQCIVFVRASPCFYMWKLNIGHAEHLAERKHGYFRRAIKPSAIRYAVRWIQSVSSVSFCCCFSLVSNLSRLFNPDCSFGSINSFFVCNCAPKPLPSADSVHTQKYVREQCDFVWAEHPDSLFSSSFLLAVIVIGRMSMVRHRIHFTQAKQI